MHEPGRLPQVLVTICMGCFLFVGLGAIASGQREPMPFVSGAWLREFKSTSRFGPQGCPVCQIAAVHAKAFEHQQSQLTSFC